jgi:hypothetical protein
VVNNVYVIKVPPDTGLEPFNAMWRIRMADGRVLTPQQLQMQIGIAGGGGGEPGPVGAVPPGPAGGAATIEGWPLVTPRP